jgi:hypothetical protein
MSNDYITRTGCSITDAHASYDPLAIAVDVDMATPEAMSPIRHDHDTESMVEMVVVMMVVVAVVMMVVAMVMVVMVVLNKLYLRLLVARQIVARKNHLCIFHGLEKVGVGICGRQG